MCTYRGITNLTVADSSFPFQWYIAYSIRGSHSFSFQRNCPLKRIYCTLCVWCLFFYFGSWWWRRRCNSWTSKASSAISTYVRPPGNSFHHPEREKHEGILVFFPSSVNFFFFLTFSPIIITWMESKEKSWESFFYLPFFISLWENKIPVRLLMGEKVKII